MDLPRMRSMRTNGMTLPPDYRVGAGLQACDGRVSPPFPPPTDENPPPPPSQRPAPAPAEDDEDHVVRHKECRHPECRDPIGGPHVGRGAVNGGKRNRKHEIE